jgi:hypothetical protein
MPSSNLTDSLFRRKTMRKLRQISMAVMLTVVLATCTFAGIIGGGPEPPPEPPSATATGIIGTSAAAAQPVDTPPWPVVDIALNLLQSVLSVF